ncbi:MAG TPA: glycoside hydrolase family 15 protein [Anaeromyxobacter sp.]|nr:glycoside hydrolase family 15 protein [Anaeromyxobacter sp.]
MAAGSRIEDHAVVGDGRSAALIDRGGDVTWLAWPRFDSPAALAAILDPERGGHLRVGPASPARAARAYVAGTNVLVTRHESAAGSLRVVDFMAVAGEEDLRRREFPEHELVRIAECARGEVEVAVEADLRPGFGAERARLRDRGLLGLRLERGAEVTTLRATVPLRLCADGVARGRAALREGDAVVVSLAFDAGGPCVLPPLDEAQEALRRTVRTWRAFSAGLTYGGPWREEVERSALVLKLLSFAPTGAIVAAPTTSLPERPGGDLNWDYRFCWLRDAALTVRALYGIGCRAEAEAFTDWLLHATRLTRPELRVLYDVYGRRPPRERTLPHLAGHGGARPVRVGNAAADQVQLDVYGQVVDAVTQVVRRGVRLDRDVQAMLRGFGEQLCRHWRDPDSGIWEPRETPRLHTHSLVLAWVALDRLLWLHARGHLGRLRSEAIARERDAIRAFVDRRCWSERLGSFVAHPDGDEVDAALLRLGHFGYEAPGSARMAGTWRLVRERLSPAPGLLYRYEPSLAVREGAFGICSFWAAEHLAAGGGSLDEAVAWMEALLARANDVGLLAEEIAPATGAALGNFPQGFTHVGLVSAALAVEARARAEARRRAGERPGAAAEAPP